jgi:hypothetical protein
MGHTFLIEQRTAGTGLSKRKVPYFAEMINERACLFWRRRGKRLDFIAAQKARFQALLRGLRDERNDCIPDWGRWSVGAVLLADDPDGEQRPAQEPAERQLQQ